MADTFNLFQAIANTLPDAVKQANEDVANKAVDNIKAHILINGQVSDNDEPGHVHMIDTVHTEPVSDGTQNVIVGAPYAAYPNYGTVHEPPNPFFEPGLQDTQDAIDAALVDIVNKMAKAGR